MSTKQLVAARAPRLSDGRELTIRPLEERDQEALLAFGMALPPSDVLYLELDFQDPQTITRLVNAATAENWRQLIAVAGDAIVGYGNVRRLVGWKNHVGDSHLVVGEGWRRKGPGTALARRVLDAAHELGVPKVIAEMLEEQTGGRAIYERMGFQPKGVLTAHVQDHRGQRHNRLVLGYPLPAA